MKKILLLMFTTLFAISVMGQPVNKKAQIFGYKNQLQSKKIQSLLSSSVKLDSTISKTWDNVNIKFVINNKIKFTYGTGTEEETDSLLYSVTNKWVATSQTEYTFDANGDETLEINSTSALTLSVPAWVNSSRTDLTYDINRHLTMYILSTWNTSLSQWVPVTKIEATYNAGGKPVLEVTSSWNIPTSAWVAMSRTESSYDINGNITTELTLVWDSTIPIPAFVNSTKTDFSFNGSNLVIEYIISDWDKTLTIPAWVFSTKTDLTYDGGGNQNLVTTYTWDVTLAIPAWVEELKMESTYDSSHRPLVIITSFWDTGTSLWIPFIKTVSTYDNIFIPPPLPYPQITGVTYDETNGFSWDIPTSQWLPSSRTDDYYSSVATLVNKTSEINLRVYPNPAKEFVVFDNLNISESATIEMFDIQGKKIMDTQLYGNDQISIKDLAKGMYVYRLHNNGIIYTGRLVKK